MLAPMAILTITLSALNAAGDGTLQRDHKRYQWFHYKKMLLCFGGTDQLAALRSNYSCSGCNWCGTCRNSPGSLTEPMLTTQWFSFSILFFPCWNGNAGIASATLNKPLLGQSTYYWRVRAINSCANNPWSSPPLSLQTTACITKRHRCQWPSVQQLPIPLNPPSLYTIGVDLHQQKFMTSKDYTPTLTI